MNATDISASKQKEEALVESEQKLRRVIEAIPHSLLIVNEDNTIDYVNEEFELVFGYTSAEVLGREIDFLIPMQYRERHKKHQKEYYRRESQKPSRMARYIPALTKAGDEII